MDRRSRQSNSHRGSVTMFLLAAIIVGAAVGGFLLLWQREGNQTDPKMILYRVQRSDFELTITERGEIESAGVTEVRSEVKTKNSPGLAILRVVAEGTKVKKGDFLVELDSSAFDAEQVLQENLEGMAEAAEVEAKFLYETAIISKEEYLDGTYVQERQTLESEVFVAEENLNRAKEYFLFSKKLAAKGYVNELQLKADGFAVEKSEKELEAAKTKLRVLDDYTKKKMAKQLESDIAITEAKWGSAKKSHELELASLQEIEDQIAKCMIQSPKDSIVIYANERDHRGSDDWVVEEGAVVRERQIIFRLPESGAMQVQLKINEALVQYVKAGMPATIVPIGVDGAELQGKVTKVNDYAEPSNWRKADVKEYKAYVSIDERSTQLRSGMTVSVTVECEFIPETLQVPVQAIHAHGADYYCFVEKNGSLEARKVECGTTNSEFFVIEKGLKEGEQVVMNPRSYLAKVNLPIIPAAPEESERPNAVGNVATDKPNSNEADSAGSKATKSETTSSS